MNPPLLFSLKQRKELHSRLEACHSLPWVETHSQKRRCKKRGWLNKQVCPFSVRNRSLLLEPVMDVHGAMEDFSLISMQKQCKWPKKWHGTKSLFFYTQIKRNISGVKHKTAFESLAFWFLTILFNHTSTTTLPLLVWDMKLVKNEGSPWFLAFRSQISSM